MLRDGDLVYGEVVNFVRTAGHLVCRQRYDVERYERVFAALWAAVDGSPDGDR